MLVKSDVDAHDCEILRSILKNDSYDLSHDDYVTLEAVITALTTMCNTQDSTPDLDR